MLLDCIDNITTEDNNIIITLQTLATGLATLYDSMRGLENKYMSIHSGNQIIFDITGSLINPLDADLTTCLYHWYATAICNYARLVGYCSLPSETPKKEINKLCNSYLGQIAELKPVKEYRDKVSAHFALTYPQDEDFGFLQCSVMSYPEFVEGRFWKGKFVFSNQNGNSTTPEWCLTLTHETLKKRFWPN